jgi:hypothetical protein
MEVVPGLEYGNPTCHLVKSSPLVQVQYPRVHGGELGWTKSSQPFASSTTCSKYATIATPHKPKSQTGKSLLSPSSPAKRSAGIGAKPSSGSKPFSASRCGERGFVFA